METIVSVLIPAIVENVFGALTEAVGLSDWLRQRLGRDPEKLAFHQALTQALTDSATHYPGRNLQYFAEILRDIGGPLLARTLQPAAPLPTADGLTTVWLNHLTVDSLIHYRSEFTQFAIHFLDRLQFHLENQQPLQWIAQARRQRSSEETMHRMADAAEQSATNIEALRQEVARLTEALVTALQTGSSSTVTTEGEAYIGGNVNAQSFAGRDLTIKNYFVAGLPRLTIDYSSRIQDFLLEYLGSKRKKVPFGGRQQQLAELNAWLDDTTAPPYYLMTAEAGRGKSALVCRWLAQLTTRPNLDVIFVPISIRFETATQDVVFAALAARLAKFYGEDDKLDLSATANERKVICELYLRRTPPAGKQLVMILDGLDEATGWTLGRSLFSTDPPDGLRVLVSARSRPGESGSSSWATTLGWDNPQLARTVILPGLDRRGMEEALTSMGNPLDVMTTKVDVVGELHRLSEGDPLLVRLYVDALLTQGSAVTKLRSETLHAIHPGLAGYFERWWQEQQEQWRFQGRDPIAEQTNLRLLLNAFAAALGPLTLDDLAALRPDLGDSLLVRRLVEQVDRWVVGDGKKQGYSYSHSRLGYYFWEQLNNQEQKQWGECFVTWGRRILQELQAGTLAPNLAPRYLLQHYVAHLDRVNAPSTDFYALVCEGWLRAWESVSGTPDGFLNDINHTWAAAKAEGAAALGQAIRVALCFSSVASISTNIDTKLLVVCVKTGVISPQLALVITRMKSEEKERLDCLTKLCAHLPSELLNTVLAMHPTMGNGEQQFKILQAVIARLPVDNDTLLAEILTAARTIGNESKRSEILSVIAEHLPLDQQASLLIEALTIALTINDKWERMRVLRSIAEHLPPEQQPSILTEALFSIHIIDDEWASNRQEFVPSTEQLKDKTFDHTRLWENTLCALVKCLSDEQKPLILNKAIAVVHTIRDKSWQAWALLAVAQHLPISAPELHTEVLSIARFIDDKWQRIQVLSVVAERIPLEQLPTVLVEALAAAHAIGIDMEERLFFPQEWPWAGVLRTIKERLPVDTPILLAEALVVVRTIRNEQGRFYALCGAVAYLPLDIPILLGEVIAIVRTIDDKYLQVKVFLAVVERLPDSQHSIVLIEVLAIINAISDQQKLVQTLGALVEHLPIEYLEQLLLVTHKISNKKALTQILLCVAERLPPDRRMDLVSIALATARSIDHEEDLVEELCTIVQYLSPKQKSFVLSEALAAAQRVVNNKKRFRALYAVAQHLPTEGKVDVLIQALTVARTIEGDRFLDLYSLLKCLPTHTQELLSHTLAVVRTIHDGGDRSSALGIVVEYLPKDAVNLLTETIEIARSIRYEDTRAKALSLVATRLSANTRDSLAEILTAISTFDNEDTRAEALGLVAESLPLDALPLLTEVLAAARAVNDRAARIRVLGVITQYLPTS